MNINHLPIEIQIYGGLFSLNNQIQSTGDKYFKDLTTKQHFILMTIDQFQNSSPSLVDIADVVGCSYQNIKKICDSLENKKYVEIKRDSNDKRKYNLIKTERINELKRINQAQIIQFIDHLFKDIDKTQLENMMEILDIMKKNLTAIQSKNLDKKELK